MKYWNKDKGVRQRCWVRVDRVFSSVPDDKIKIWCQQQPGSGRFYFRYNEGTWWFEKAEDAVFFTLKWT